MKLSPVAGTYWAVVLIAFLGFVIALISMIVCYASYQGSDPKNWTTSIDSNSNVFAHIDCCKVVDAACSRRGCQLTLKYPILRNQVFSNYSLQQLGQLRPFEILEKSKQFNCSGYISSNYSSISYLTLEGVKTYVSGNISLIDDTVSCYTDYSEESSVAPNSPSSFINESLEAAGMALAIISGLIMCIILIMIGLFIFCSIKHRV